MKSALKAAIMIIVEAMFVFTCPVAFVKENCARNKTNKQQKIISILNHSGNRFIADKKIFLSKAGQ